MIIPVFAALPAFLAKDHHVRRIDADPQRVWRGAKGSLSWFIKLYPKLMRWSSAVERLGQFEHAIAASRCQAQAPVIGDCLDVSGPGCTAP